MTTLTSTIAWRTCIESAHIAHWHGAPSLTRFAALYFFLFLLSVSVFLFHLELFPELLHTKVMANLRLSTAKESEDTLNVFISPTGYEPNLLTFGELNDSSVPFSFMIPSTDQDVDDVTPGEMLTAAHRGQVEYCVPGGMSVSQSSSVMFDGSGQPDGERMVDQSGKSSVTFNVIVRTATFLKTSKLRKWSIDQGNLMSVTARKHRLGLYLKSKDRRLSRNIAKKSVITNSMQLTQKKSADSYKDNYGDRNWNFVKLVNKVLQRWKNYGNSRVLPSILSRDENLSRIRTLFWNYQAEYERF